MRFAVSVAAWFALAQLVWACKGDAQAPAPAPSPKPAPRVDPEPTPKPAPPAYTEAQRAAYRSNLARGRALSRGGKWGEAAAAFDAALDAIPMDGRALSELGWAAFQAGDYERAREANRASARAATDPAVRAASLYNLGRVAEALGDADEAARRYRESLALRPHEQVQQRLAALGESAPAAGQFEPADLPCRAPMAKSALCPCLVQYARAARSAVRARPADADAITCILEPRDVTDAEIAMVGDDVEERAFLVAARENSWAVVAPLGAVYHPGDYGIHESLEIAAFAHERLGERRLLRVETIHEREAIQAGVGAIETRRVSTLTLCVVPRGDEPWRCPLSVPLRARYTREPTRGDGDGDPPRVSGTRTAAAPAERAKPVGPIEPVEPIEPIEREQRLDVTLRPDGAASVVLVAGEKDAAVAPLLGPRRLW